LHSTLAGIDTEYGFTIEGRTVHDQAEDSIQFVKSLPDSAFLAWNYQQESPRLDMRGFQVERLAVDPADAEFDANRARPAAAHERADRVLSNGGRFYNDHGHPEYATPECWTLADLIEQEQAGDKVVLRAAAALSQILSRKVDVYKNNTDFHGASWGTHENYLVSRSIPFADLANCIIPMLIARQVLTGSGKVGSESGGPVRYQLSQRADFFVEPMNIETLYRRPVFNTRDEPHAPAQTWRRLHVITGDSNMNPACTRRKVALVKIALLLADRGAAPKWPIPDPVASFKMVSRDSTGEGRIDLEGRNWTTPRQVLESYLDAAAQVPDLDPELQQAITECNSLLEARFSSFDDFWPSVDWASKYWLLDHYAERVGGWKNQTAMQSLDLQYHLLDEEDGLYFGLLQAGVLKTPQFGSTSPTAPPAGSRAVIRSAALTHLSTELEAVSWGKLRFKNGGELDLPPDRWYEGAPQSVESVEELRNFYQL
jgi:proteasome accessory factor A